LYHYATEPNLHTTLLPLAIFSVLAYPLGIIALFGGLFYKFRHVLKQGSTYKPFYLSSETVLPIK
jgi:hypothetical protein